MPDRRRQDLRTGLRLPRPLPPGGRRHRLFGFVPHHAGRGRLGSVPAKAPPSSTPTSSGLTPIRSPTTSASTRPPPSAQAEAARDPVLTFPQFLVDEGILDRQMLQRILHEIDEEVHEATEQAMRDEPPAPESVFLNLYSPEVDPAADSFAAQPHFTGAPMTMVDLINATLREEMRRNPRHPGLRRRCRRLLPRAQSPGGQRQGWSLQSHRRPAGRVRRGPQLQHAAGRGRHRGPRHRHGDARPEACGRDSILRLHLACYDADSR